MTPQEQLAKEFRRLEINHTQAAVILHRNRSTIKRWLNGSVDVPLWVFDVLKTLRHRPSSNLGR